MSNGFGDLLIDVFELQLELLFLFISDAHHLLKVFFDLDHLFVEASKFLIGFFGCLIHPLFLIDFYN